MLNFWYVVNISAVVILILAVLLQQTSSGVLGGGASSNIQSLLSKRGAVGFLSKLISVTAVVYFVSAVTLSFLYSRQFDDVEVLIQDAIDELVDKKPQEQDLPITDQNDDNDPEDYQDDELVQND